MFITFEGGDGAGKTTQIELLKAALEKEGRSVVVTREPGGNAVAEKIRELLLDRASVMEDMTEAYLYAAARAEHVRAVILPALARGQVVLCDRFIDSSVAYQGYGRQIGAERVEALNREAVDGCMPERTYLLTLSEQDAAQRVKNRDGCLRNQTERHNAHALCKRTQITSGCRPAHCFGRKGKACCRSKAVRCG